MKILKVKNDFTLKGNYYEKGDEINSNNFTIEEIVRMNEKGFIEPLSQKEIISLSKNENNENKEEIIYFKNKNKKTKEGE